MKYLMFLAALSFSGVSKADPYNDSTIENAGFILGYLSQLMADIEHCNSVGSLNYDLHDANTDVHQVKTLYLQYTQHQNSPDFTKKWNESALLERVRTNMAEIEPNIDCDSVRQMAEVNLKSLDEVAALRKAVTQADIMPDYKDAKVQEYLDSLVRVEHAVAIARYCFSTFAELNKNKSVEEELTKYANAFAWYFTNDLAPDFLEELFIKFSGSDGLKKISEQIEYLELRQTSKTECKEFLEFDLDANNFLSAQRLSQEVEQAKLKVISAN